MTPYSSAVMVGRDQELAALLEHAASGSDRSPSAAVVLGEAGVGKSRLVMEAVSQLERDGAIVVASHGVELAGGEVPFGGVTEVVRDLVRVLGLDDARKLAEAHIETLAAFHSGLGRASGSPEQAAVVGAMLALLEGVADSRRLCWVLDDLQWMDSPTVDLSAYMARVVRGQLILFATVRTQATAPDLMPERLTEFARLPDASVFALAPLSTIDVRAQVRSIAGQALNPAQLTRICELSDGLPFFVEQLVANGGESPASLRSVVSGGLGRLSDDARAMLRVAAIGETLLLPVLLQEVAGLDDARFSAALRETRDRGVLRRGRTGEVLRFRHALLREAVEEELLTGERRALHRRWAEAVDHLNETAFPASVLVAERGLHWYGTGDAVRAFKPVLDAARMVENGGDLELSARWWGRALELWGDEEERHGVRRDWAVRLFARGLVGGGRVEDAVRLVQGELQRGGDWLRLMWLRAYREQGNRLLSLPTTPVVSIQEADTTFARLRELPPDFRVDEVLHLLMHEWEYERPDLVEPVCSALLERARDGDDLEMMHMARRHLGWWELAEGRPEAQLDQAALAVDELEHVPALRPEAMGDLAAAYANGGRYREALRVSEAAIAELTEPRIQLLSYMYLTEIRVWALADIGEWDEAISAAVDAEPLGEHVLYGPSLRIHRARVLACRGESAAAADLLNSGPPLEPDEGSLTELFVYRSHVRLEAEEPDFTPAEAIAALGGVKNFGVAGQEGWRLLVTALRRLRAAAPTDAVQAQIERLPTGGPINGASAAEAAAHLDRLAGSDTSIQWRDSAEHWAALSRMYDEAWCRLYQAEADLRGGSRAEATQVLSQAAETCDRLGAQPLRERILGTAQRGRLDLGVPPSRRAGLTARETEVLLRLAIGRTNVQIATDLHMSPKTASVHVSRIIAKLGAANRTEAAAWAHRNGLIGTVHETRS